MAERFLSRRAVMAAGAVALGAAALPAGILEALSAEAASTSIARPTVFDPAAFVAELRTIGCSVTLVAPHPAFGGRPTTYAITSADGRGFGAGYFTLMARWIDALGNCPDHVDRVTAHLAERDGWPA